MRLRKGLRLPMLFACFVFLFLPSTSRLYAQTFNLQSGREPIASLNGLWHFHTGDNPAWASPNFDDSQWPLLRSNEDWGKQGYKGYSGVAWYRFTLQVPDGSKPLSLLLPYVFTSYQVFADGRLIDGCGGMPPHAVARFCHTQVFALPSIPSAGPRTVSLAIRVWQWPTWAAFNGGGPQGTSYAGAPESIQDRYRAVYDPYARLQVQYYFLALLAFLGALVSITLFLYRRGEREYLWFGCMLLMEAAETAWRIYGRYSFHTINVVGYFTCRGLLMNLQWFAAIAFFYVLLRGRRSWLFYLAVAGTVLYLTEHVMFPYILTDNRVGIGVFNIIANITLLPTILWIVVLLARRAREKEIDALLLLAPVILVYGNRTIRWFVFAAYELGWQHRFTQEAFPILVRPFPLASDVLADFIFLVAMVAILVNRFARTRREEERYAGEIEAARTMQSLLIPLTAPSTPGFNVESVYLPASEVGGDFFQVQPGDDGSLLIVVGDVSGKGLKAAMTVSTIVGALRDYPSRQPLEVLGHLNRVLHGQIKGFVTCCAMLIAADGAMTVANAGHIPPYRNGKELAIPSALPLGTIAESGYEETQFELAPGDRLTFVSDGVVEATNAKRELFGFDRAQRISREPVATIAETARRFGQEDDITVVAIQYAGATILAGS